MHTYQEVLDACDKRKDNPVHRDYCQQVLSLTDKLEKRYPRAVIDYLITKGFRGNGMLAELKRSEKGEI